MNRNMPCPVVRHPRRTFATASAFAFAVFWPFNQQAVAEWGGVGGDSRNEPQVLNITAADTDGDGIPNTWEDANLLNKANPADARSDFDLDGLTALQEHQLSLDNPGYGKPLGKWTMAALPKPTEFTTANPSVTLIEVASNGTILARVQGILTGTTVTTSYPYIWSPATGWRRVATPEGYPAVTSLTPLDVNSSGQVVGYFNSGGTKGFLWTPDANGGRTTVFYLNPGIGQTLAIPKRISDAGYITGNVGTLNGRSIAATVGGREIIFPSWSNPTYQDVNGYGEFVGTVYNPLTFRNETFLACEGFPVYQTGIGPNALQDLPGVWGDIPDIDPDSITWVPDPSGYGQHRAGTAIDRQTQAIVNLHEGYGASFYWESTSIYYGGAHLWYAYPGFSQVFGAVNDWGEFAGLYSGSMYQTSFDYYGAQIYDYSFGTATDNGIFFYEGSYHISKSRPSIYSVSNDPRVLIGTPFAIWSGSQVVPITNLIPAGNPTNFTSARLADNGKVILQGSPTTQIYILKPYQDADSDGMPDDWEKYYGFSPNNASDASADADRDGISNYAEFKFRTNPTQVPVPGSPGQFIDIRPGIDTDGDGMPNVWEWKHGLNYNDASDASRDADNDGLTNRQEFRLGTNPNLADTDGDHISDGDEVLVNFTNPLSAVDLDADGMCDDWEASEMRRLLIAGILITPTLNSYGRPSLNPGDDNDGDGASALQEYYAGTSDADADDYNEAAVKYPIIWAHRLVDAGVSKTGTFQEFTPTVAPVPSTPVVGYYLKKTVIGLNESSSNGLNTATHSKYGTTDIITRDSKTLVESQVSTVDFNISVPPNYGPNFNNGVWEEVSRSDTRTITKTVDNASGGGTYKITSNGLTGSESYSNLTTLSDEYTTGMLIEAGNKKFDLLVVEEEKKSWGKGFPSPEIETYTTKDETQYRRMEIDYALEPRYSLDAPVRVAWLDVNRTDLGRGYQWGPPDPAATQSISLHEEYYSKAKAWTFLFPSDAKLPRTEIRRLSPALNMEMLILPLSCSLDVNFNLGSLLVTHDANGQSLPIDWEDPDGGYLDVNFSHNHGANYVQYGDIVGDEFDVPVKLEAVEGGANIRLAEIITTSSGTTFLPVSLPIADVRAYTEGFVVQAISPGKVTLKASLTTKHGMRVSKRAQVENTLPPVSLVVISNGIGSMVPSVKQGCPDHFVTPKSLPTDKVIVQASIPGKTPEFLREFYEWSLALAGSVDPNDPAKFEIARGVALRTSATIRDKKSKKEISKMMIWMVWANSVPEGQPFRTGITTIFNGPEIETIAGPLSPTRVFRGSQLYPMRFVFVIAPSSIITDVNQGLDAPDLTGPVLPSPEVPGGSGSHSVLGSGEEAGSSGGTFKYGASHRWDVSRQMEVTINNPDLIPYNDFSAGMHDLYKGQLENPRNPVSIPFPTDPVMGNDDVGTIDRIAADEDNNPYVTRSGTNTIDMNHSIGSITSTDAPSSQITQKAGNQGRSYEELDHFREFVRLQLGNGWYRISDPVEWKFEMRVIHDGTKWNDNGSLPTPIQ